MPRVAPNGIFCMEAAKGAEPAPPRYATHESSAPAHVAVDWLAFGSVRHDGAVPRSCRSGVAPQVRQRTMVACAEYGLPKEQAGRPIHARSVDTHALRPRKVEQPHDHLIRRKELVASERRSHPAG